MIKDSDPSARRGAISRGTLFQCYLCLLRTDIDPPCHKARRRGMQRVTITTSYVVSLDSERLQIEHERRQWALSMEQHFSENISSQFTLSMYMIEHMCRGREIIIQVRSCPGAATPTPSSMTPVASHTLLPFPCKEHSEISHWDVSSSHLSVREYQYVRASASVLPSQQASISTLNWSITYEQCGHISNLVTIMSHSSCTIAFLIVTDESCTANLYKNKQRYQITYHILRAS